MKAMLSEDEKLLNAITKKVQSLIEKECEKQGIDRAYFDFKLEVKVKSYDFSESYSITLFDDDVAYNCNFCHKPTYYYDKDYGWICPECLRRLRHERK